MCWSSRAGSLRARASARDRVADLRCGLGLAALAPRPDGDARPARVRTAEHPSQGPMTHRSQPYIRPIISSESAKPVIMRANLRALRPTLDRWELDRLHAAPRWTLATGGPAQGRTRAPRHSPDTPEPINPASKAQPGPHRGFYAEVGDRLQAARRFAGLHAVARDVGLASGAAATAAIAWMTGGPMGTAPVGTRRRRSSLHAVGSTRGLTG